MNDTYIIIADNLMVKEEMSATSTSMKVLYKGNKVVIVDIQGNWHKTTNGWWIWGINSKGEAMLGKVDSGTPVPQEKSSIAGASATKPTSELTPEEVLAEQEQKRLADLNYKSTVQAQYSSQLNGLKINTLKGIHGMPYQFMQIADTRIDNDPASFGRKYAEKIVAKMPLLLMNPGNPEFLSSYSDSEKKGFIGAILDNLGDKSRESDLDALLKREGRYYTLKPDYPAYFNHVNPMCRATARFLGIHTEKINGTDLDNYDWSKNTNSTIDQFNYNGASAFYINSDTQISESFSNNVTESMLAGKTNQLSDMGREINFLLGGASAQAGLRMDMMKQQNLNGTIQNNQDMASGILGGSSFMKSIVGGMTTVFAGGKLVFPEIWSDSHFARSYSVNMKLTTPDCDKLSWYLNIGVPMLHLIGFTSPRQAGPNGYVAPFLVRASYKGMINCDMGIITDMTFNKGSEGGWTKDMLPTSVDVSFTIKDLYSAMAITSNNGSVFKNGLMNNMVLMDYLANMCGININEPDIKRVLTMYLTQNVRNRVVDLVQLGIVGNLDQWFTEKVLNIYKMAPGVAR